MPVAPRRPATAKPVAAFFRIVWEAVWTAAKGLRVTGTNIVARKRVTVAYPLNKLDVSPRVRGRHRILQTDGDPLCIACGACQRICPDHCIEVTRTKVTITTPEGEEKTVNRPETFRIDLARCMYCNLCAEACPVNCLHLTPDYSFVASSTAQLVIDLEGLLRAEPLSEYELRQAEKERESKGADKEPT